MKNYLFLLCCFLLLGTQASAALLWSEDFDDNDWSGTLDMESGFGLSSPQGCAGTISFSTVTSPTRAGTRAAQLVLKRCQGRAEFREKSRNRAGIGDQHYYGFSLRPAANYDTNPITIVMQGAQWYGGIPSWAEGAWHRIEIDGGRWYYIYKYSQNGQTGAAGIRETRVDLGPVVRNAWTDFVIRGRWNLDNNGRIKVWMRSPGSTNYEVKHNYTGWVIVNVPQAPYFKLGQYRSAPGWPGNNDEEFLYVDEIRVGTSFNDVIVPAGSSSAFPDPNRWYTIRNTAHGTRYLRAGNSEESWDVNTTGSKGAWERWRFVDAGNGFYYIRNGAHSGNRNLQGMSSAQNWVVRTSTNQGSWEKWKLVDAGGGNYFIRNSDHGGGRNLQAWPNTGNYKVLTSNNQGTWERWQIVLD
ncbi:MAG: heparin lyase I family protein [Puniceicoccaceae bacterium]